MFHSLSFSHTYTHTYTHTGDRIAIISNGSLICCGSFEFLRRHFGRGHRLTLVTSSQSERRSSTASRTLTVTVDIEDTDHAPKSPSPTYQPEFASEDSAKKISRFIQVSVCERFVSVPLAG